MGTRSPTWNIRERLLADLVSFCGSDVETPLRLDMQAKC